MPTITPKQAEPPLILTVDVGSSSTRALLFDSLGRAVADCDARLASTFSTTPDGGSEDDVEAAIARIEQCIDGTLRTAGPLADTIAAVALATYVPNMLGVDTNGHPLTPIYPYADTRSSAAATELRAHLNENNILDRTGCPLRSSYLPARLRWLQHTTPDTVQQVRHWMSLGEYALIRFFGTTHVSVSVASWSGLLNRHTLDWDEQLLAELGIDRSQLSPLATTAESMTGLRPVYAQRWPALANVPWFPAIGDGAAANVGSGCLSPERVALTIGTTGAIRVVTPIVERVPWGLWCHRVDRQRALLGGATSEGGNIFAWLTNILKLGNLTGLEHALQQRDPDSHGLTVLPFIAGERSPGWAGDVRATIIGMHLGTTASDIVQASLEAVAYRFALIAQLLKGILPNIQMVVASGGAALNSPAWLQILADVLGYPIHTAADIETTSRGAALLALESLGVLPDLAALPLQYAQSYEPNAAHHTRYVAAIARQQDWYDKLIG